MKASKSYQSSAKPNIYAPNKQRQYIHNKYGKDRSANNNDDDDWFIEQNDVFLSLLKHPAAIIRTSPSAYAQTPCAHRAHPPAAEWTAPAQRRMRRRKPVSKGKKILDDKNIFYLKIVLTQHSTHNQWLHEWPIFTFEVQVGAFTFSQFARQCILIVEALFGFALPLLPAVFAVLRRRCFAITAAVVVVVVEKDCGRTLKNFKFRFRQITPQYKWKFSFVFDLMNPLCCYASRMPSTSCSGPESQCCCWWECPSSRPARPAYAEKSRCFMMKFECCKPTLWSVEKPGDRSFIATTTATKANASTANFIVETLLKFFILYQKNSVNPTISWLEELAKR